MAISITSMLVAMGKRGKARTVSHSRTTACLPQQWWCAILCTMETMETYLLKLYDMPLASFEFTRNEFGEMGTRGLEVDKGSAHLLPLNLVQSPTQRELDRWLETRRIPRNRAFVEQILRPFGVSAGDTRGIIDLSKGASINDAYSVVPQGDDARFADYNLFDNSFDEVLQLIAYTGVIPPEALGSGIPSELSPSGSFPKAWRIIDGDRVLFKAASAIKASNTGKEPYSELLAYRVADAMGLDCVAYDVTEWQGEVCSTCRLFNTRDVSFVPFGYALVQQDFEQMNLERALAWFSNVGACAAEKFRSMLVFDSIIANPDRHLGNYGILRDNATGCVLDVAPVFDNNLSLFTHEYTEDLDLDFMLRKNGETPGAFSPTVVEQARHLLGSVQRRQVERLAGFELRPTEFMRRKATKDPAAADAFPQGRIDSLNAFITRRVSDLLEPR